MNATNEKPGLAKTKPSGGWMGIDEAADFLGISIITLRRSIERNAKTSEDGARVAQFDGIAARKLGRLWRVRLDEKWTAMPTGTTAT